MKFEEALEAYNTHPYHPTKKETIYQKKKKKLKEEYELSHFATSTWDVRGLQKDVKDRIVRRVIKVPVINIGDIRI